MVLFFAIELLSAGTMFFVTVTVHHGGLFCKVCGGIQSLDERISIISENGLCQKRQMTPLGCRPARKITHSGAIQTGKKERFSSRDCIRLRRIIRRSLKPPCGMCDWCDNQAPGGVPEISHISFLSDTLSSIRYFTFSSRRPT